MTSEVVCLILEQVSAVPGPLQTVQRSEFWEVIRALQASSAVHLGSIT